MKVSQKQIIEIFDNNEDGKSKTQIAAELGITIQALNRRLKKMSVKVEDYVESYARRRALITANELAKQSKNGQTAASKELLRLAKIGSESLLMDGNEWAIIIQRVESKSDDSAISDK